MDVEARIGQPYLFGRPAERAVPPAVVDEAVKQERDRVPAAVDCRVVGGVVGRSVVIDGEVHATKCDFLVPQVGANFDGPTVMRYRYRVPHPYCVMLYYDSLPDPAIEDIVAVWVQPMTAVLVRAHNYMGVIDDTSSDNDIKAYQLHVFGEDKPILENQYPKRLPLDPPAETPIRADKSAIAYRRRLSSLGVTYEVIPSSR